MDEMEDKLNSILSSPQLMSQIMSMAQSMGQDTQEKDTASPAFNPLPDLDPAMLQRLSGLAMNTGVDKNQQALLHALSPYLPHERIGKLEKAMRAAKMARLASGFLGEPILQGR